MPKIWNTVTEIKNALNGLLRRISKVNECEDSSTEITKTTCVYAEIHIHRHTKWKIKDFKNLWDNMKYSNKHIYNWCPRRNRDKQTSTKEIFEKIMTKTFPN